MAKAENKKAEFIREIMARNRTASEESLGGYSEEELREYLEHLKSLESTAL